MHTLLALQAGGMGGLVGILPFVFIFAIFYLVLILPQQKRQKKWQAMLESMKTGDRVVTAGGLRGTVIAIKDDSVHLRVPPDNLRMEVTKASVTQLITADEEKEKKAS